MKPSDDDDVTAVFKNYRGELRHPMPDQLKRTILNQVAGQGRRVNPWTWFLFGSGVAAASLALILSFQFGRMMGVDRGAQRGPEEVISSHVRSLMATHLSDVASTDQHTVKPWFEGRLDFGPTVKDFAEKGYPLVGGRLDYLSNRPAAALIYKHGQHIINVFEYPAPSSEFVGAKFVSIRGYQVFSWSEGGMSFWAVSDLNAADLQNFVEMWR